MKGYVQGLPLQRGHVAHYINFGVGCPGHPPMRPESPSLLLCDIYSDTVSGIRSKSFVLPSWYGNRRA